jgi:hypothetical protein
MTVRLFLKIHNICMCALHVGLFTPFIVAKEVYSTLLNHIQTRYIL